MGVKGAVGADQAPFCGGQLPTAMHNCANGPQSLHFGGDGANQINAQFSGGVSTSNWHFAVDGAAHGRIQNGGKPTTMRGTHGIQVQLAGCPLKNSPAVFNLKQLEVKRLTHGGIWQATLKHVLHHLQARQIHDFRGMRNTRAAAIFKTLQDDDFLSQPLFKYWVCCHGDAFDVDIEIEIEL